MTGGKPASEGPLALKRELREAEGRLAKLETGLAQAEAEAAALTQAIEELAAQLEARSEERRLAERDAANQGAALKQMEAETQRIERRLQEWTAQAARNKDAREAKRSSHRPEARGTAAPGGRAPHGRSRRSMSCRPNWPCCAQKREGLQQEAAQVTAELAGLEERRRGAEAAFQRIDRLHADLERRVLSIEQQRAAAAAEREQRIARAPNWPSASRNWPPRAPRRWPWRRRSPPQAQALRQQLADHGDPTQDRARRARPVARGPRQPLQRSGQAARRPGAPGGKLPGRGQRRGRRVCAPMRRSTRLAGEELAAEEETCRALRQRIEQMGPVNMMALDEYKETAERHGFLETQRKDLIESIENTQETIKEIDQISRTKFDEAFARINENFAQVFARLFQGGQAFLRLTDVENQAESGLDIVASPPGKKLQNVLLLSGGEKSLTALALLVGIFQFQPSPFCVLDEVDAALDETNVGRLADLLHSLSKETQFLLVTHSKRMMQAADMIYGVTMQEPGVSKVISVRLAGGREQQRATA